MPACASPRTTRVAEVYVVIVRFWKNGKVAQRVIGLKLLDHPLTGPENCGVLVATAATAQLRWSNCIQFVADRAGTNTVAVDMLSPQAPKAFLQGCLSHTLTHVGDKNTLEHVNDFASALASMAFSTNARACFKKHFGETMKRFQKVRWYVKYEMIKQVFLNYVCLDPWVLECELHDHAPESTKKIRAVMARASQTLQLEMCMLVDAIEPFVQATYALEADTVLTFKVHDQLATLQQHVALVREGGAAGVACPNTRAVATRLIDLHFPHALQPLKDQRIAQLIEEQLLKIEPCFTYFEEKLIELSPALRVFKAAQLFHPSKIDAMGVVADAVDTLLQDIPLIDAPTRAQLLRELPAYRATVISDPAITANTDVEGWWASKDGDLTIKAWYETAIKVMLLQPSSAAAERVFSMLKALMGDQQASRALEDYQQAGLMIHYNQLMRRTV